MLWNLISESNVLEGFIVLVIELPFKINMKELDWGSLMHHVEFKLDCLQNTWLLLHTEIFVWQWGWGKEGGREGDIFHLLVLSPRCSQQPRIGQDEARSPSGFPPVWQKPKYLGHNLLSPWCVIIRGPKQRCLVPAPLVHDVAPREAPLLDGTLWHIRLNKYSTCV